MFRITVQSEGSEGNPHYWLMKMENLLFRSRPSAVRLYSVEKINMSRVIKSGVMVNAISRSCTSMVSLSRLSDSNVILDQGETLGLFKIGGTDATPVFMKWLVGCCFPQNHIICWLEVRGETRYLKHMTTWFGTKNEKLDRSIYTVGYGPHTAKKNKNMMKANFGCRVNVGRGLILNKMRHILFVIFGLRKYKNWFLSWSWKS